MKRFSATVVVVLLVLMGRTGDLVSTPSQEGAIGQSAIPETADASSYGAVEAYLAGFPAREMAAASVVPGTSGTMGRELASELEIPADSLTGVVRQYCVVCHKMTICR